jgi:hypothetical protein
MYPKIGYIMYKVFLTGKADSGFRKLRTNEQKKAALLLNDLRDYGPVQKGWRNFSAIGKSSYHCHLSYKWVVCWRVNKKQKTIEVFSADSRENAPY